MSTDELDRWLEALAGRDVDGGSEEGRALRAHIRAQTPDPVAAVEQIDRAREAQLIARARAAGLLAAENPRLGRGAGTPRRPWLARASLMAATFAGIAIGVTTWWYTRVPTETFRGAANGIVELEARNPRALELRLMQELKDVGVNATGYERLGRIGLDADLPLPVAQNVRRVLEQHHIPVPSDGALVVEIRAPGVE
jgi:hypothetical protein